MSNVKKYALISPLLGAAVLTIMSMLYLMIVNISLKENELVEFSFALAKLLPLLMFIFTIISYTLSLPIGYLIYKEFERNFRSENFFVNLSLFIGFIIAVVIALIDYHLHNSILKSIFIVMSISIMAIANANYFMILSGYLKLNKQK